MYCSWQVCCYVHCTNHSSNTKWPLVVSIYNTNFKIFHLNHDKWKNNTEIVEIWNFRAKNPTILMWYEKSADVGLFGMSSTTTLGRSLFWERRFFFCDTVNFKNYFTQFQRPRWSSLLIYLYHRLGHWVEFRYIITFLPNGNQYQKKIFSSVILFYLPSLCHFDTYSNSATLSIFLLSTHACVQSNESTNNNGYISPAPPKVGYAVKHGSKNLCFICAICVSKSRNLRFSPLLAISFSVLGDWGLCTPVSYTHLTLPTIYSV